jgi:hypothetical protein
MTTMYENVESSGAEAGEVFRDLANAVSQIEKLDWQQIANELNEQGSSILKRILTPEECVALTDLYPNEIGFRSRVVMGRHGFGRGEYKYFSYPLPGIVQALRTALYRELAPVANQWNQSMGIEIRYPLEHADFIQRCHDAGQARPTPLLVGILLGGEFVLTEQRPRMQSRPEVVPLRQGDAVAFAVHHRPVQGTRGTYRVNLRHGVGRLRFGQRHTVGIIFHDAN